MPSVMEAGSPAAMSSVPTASAAPPQRPPKRRGRPRSPVFAFFRRLVDENGGFVGNECQFCTFVSRDRSENPTYLTRHILRTCSAPQHVKDEMGVRHPSIALSSFGNGKYKSLKHSGFPNATVNVVPAAAHTSSRKPTARKESKAVAGTRPLKPSGVLLSEQNHKGGPQQATEMRLKSHIQQSTLFAEHGQREGPQDGQKSEHRQRQGQELLVKDLQGDVQRPHQQEQQPQQEVEKPYHAAELEQGVGSQPVTGKPYEAQNHCSVIREASSVPVKIAPASGGDVQRPHQQEQRLQQEIETPHNAAELEQGVGSQPVTGKPYEAQNHCSVIREASSVPVKIAPASGRDNGESKQNLNPRLKTTVPSTRTLVQPAGVTKTRRGRPRSPALLQFRRHVDEKGTFIANQCLHCSFVSRDRSQNSTLLLRHLLSEACSSPEEIRIVLRGNRYTADGKRVTKVGKALSKAPAKSQTRGRSAGVKTGKGVRFTTGCNRDAKSVMKAVACFLQANDLEYRVVDSEAFKDMISSICTTAIRPTGVSDKAEPETKPAPAIGDGFASSPEAESRIAMLPSVRQLESFWRDASTSGLRHDGQQGNREKPTHLIIHFPRMFLEERPGSQTAWKGASSTNWLHSVQTPLASFFSWSSDVHLEYLGSKNCSGDFSNNLTEIVNQCQERCLSNECRFDQILISRPFGNADNAFTIPRNDPDNVWILDVAREVDILCQELLGRVPLLVRCVRRNRLLASFFRERYSDGVASVLFAANAAEKKAFRRYATHIRKQELDQSCLHVLEDAVETYNIIRQAQLSHENPQRLQETGSFLHTITEESVGCVQLCQETTRLVLSVPYGNELQAFISVLTPLSNMISAYTLRHEAEMSTNRASLLSTKAESRVFADRQAFISRSIAYVLPDTVQTLRELYDNKLSDHESDLRVLRGHTACRLLGKGGDGNPPIVDDICYVAAFLNPNADLSSTQGVSVEEAWRRVVSFLYTQYNSSTDVAVDRVLEQLQSFYRRSGVFSSSDLFQKTDQAMNPATWWKKHGSLAPELAAIAEKVLGAPTSAFRLVHFISEKNATEGDLATEEIYKKREKCRMLAWNWKLASLQRDEY